MQRNLLSMSLILLAQILMINSAHCSIFNLPFLVENDTLSTIIIDLDDCLSSSTEPGSNSDFSEFTAIVNNSSACANLELEGGHIYRENAIFNGHSCTPGLNGTNAMCVASLNSCDFEVDSEKALRFDVTVTPTNGNAAVLHELRFFEKAPLQYDWIDGPSGTNNYPQYYGIRVTANGVVIYEDTQIDTENDWNLEVFDFSDSTQFIVNEVTTFNFELLPYCPIGNTSPHSVWDLEDIQLSSGCIPFDGGDIAFEDGSSSIEICAGDGQEDLIDVNIDDTFGPNQSWILSTADSTIIDITSIPPFDFENATGATNLIWHIAYLNGVQGLELSQKIGDLTGFYSLSNELTVIRNEVAGGILTFDDLLTEKTICVGEGIDDDVEVTVTGELGINNSWIVTDIDGIILELPTTLPLSFENAGAGTCLIWHVAYNDGLELLVGNDLDNLEGCYALSNHITINRVDAQGGEISLEDGLVEIDLCLVDNMSNLLDIQLSGESGSEFTWLTTNQAGDILATSDIAPNDFQNIATDTIIIYHLASGGLETLPIIGENMLDITGCLSLSNSITIYRSSIETGNLTLSDGLQNIIICADDGESDEFSVILTDQTSESSMWIVVNGNGTIIDFPSGPNFDFDGTNEGVCFLYSLAYNGDIDGVEVDANLSEISGCYTLSNAISITKLIGENCDLVICDAEGGTIALADGTNTITVCADDGIEELITPDLTDNEGDNSLWFVTDIEGNILDIPGALPINVEGTDTSTCLIWHVSFNDVFMGLEVGNNLSDLSGCYSLSNSIIVTKLTGADCDEFNCEAEGGEILYEGGGTEYAICVGDTTVDLIAIELTGNIGTNSMWAITTVGGTILHLDESIPLEIDDLNPGVCLIYHIAYEDPLMGMAIDSSINSLVGCYDISNALILTKITGPACDNLGCDVEGGSISMTDGTTELEICVGDGISDAFDVVLANEVGDSMVWIITDASGNIMGIQDTATFDFEGSGTGICIVWHIAFDESLIGLTIGNTLTNLEGCYDLSNNLTVTKYDGDNCDQIGCEVEGGLISLVEDGTNTTTVCNGDGLDDFVYVNLEGNVGSNSQWIIADVLTGVITDLPTMMPYNFEETFDDVSFIYHLSYESGTTGIAVGNTVSDIAGCFSLSNQFFVFNEKVSGGDLVWEGDSLSLEICVGDAVSDTSHVVLTNALGDSLQWIIADENNIIVSLPDSFPIDFEFLDAGTCTIYNVSFNNDDLVGLEVGENINELAGFCFQLSNGIELIKLSGDDCMDGIISEKEIDFTVGPNPTSSSFAVKFHKFQTSRAIVKLFDSNGRQIATSFTSGEDVSFEMESSAAGIYHVLVVTATSSTAKKLVKIK